MRKLTKYKLAAILKSLRRVISRKQVTPNTRSIPDLVSTLSTPAVHVLKENKASLSHFGGLPNLPPTVPWPERNGKKLGFLARLSLSEIQQVCAIDWLPSSGALLFFYDIDQQPWGFEIKDRDGSSVLLVPDLPHAILQPEVIPNVKFASPPHRNISFCRVNSFPSWDRDSIRSLNLSDKESDMYSEILGSGYKSIERHQVSGFPNPVQGDSMELECQLVTNGLYCGDSSGYKDPRAEALKPGAKNWKLLFQVDSDDDLGIMWGDCGTIYYWVEENAAKNGDFKNSWLILQCC